MSRKKAKPGQSRLFLDENLQNFGDTHRIPKGSTSKGHSARLGEELSISQCCRCPNKGAIFVYAGEQLCRACWRKIWDNLPYSKRGY